MLRRAIQLSGVLTTVVVVAACATSVRHHSLLGDASPIGAPLGATTTVAIAPATLGPTTTGAPTTTVAPTTTTLPGRPPRPYSVGVTSLDLTDTSRKTGSSPSRYLPTLVFYPAVGANPGAETQGAAPLYNSWPLVVFAEGYNTTPTTYHDLLHHLATAGFVVAAPAFPLETQGGTLDENDLVNEPADLAFVITQTLAASQAPGVLNGMIDPTKIGLVGHSDGGEAVLGAAFPPGHDPRVGPVVAMSAQAVLNNDHPGAATTRHPLLVVQGTADPINPPAKGDNLFATAPSPKAYLRLFGATHLPPITDANQWRPVVEATVVDWLDAWFGGPNAATAATRLGKDADITGVASIQLG